MSCSGLYYASYRLAEWEFKKRIRRVLRRYGWI